MAFKFTKNIKVAMILTDGELVFELRRPPNEELNAFLHDQIGLKSEGVELWNDKDRLRVAMYDRFIEAAYVENGKGREDLVGENDEPIGPQDLPEDVKANVVIKGFEMTTLQIKNC